MQIIMPGLVHRRLTVSNHVLTETTLRIIFDRIADFFCRTHIAEAKECLRHFICNNDAQAFLRLKKMCSVAYQSNFKISFEQNALSNPFVFMIESHTFSVSRCFKKDVLVGVCLSGLSLRNAKLAGAYLCRVDLSGADLSEADMRGADVRWANMSRTLLYETDLSGVYLANTKLDGAKLNNTKLDNAIMNGLKLGRISLNGTKLRKTNLDGVSISLHLPTVWCANDLDLNLNHFNNGRSVLTAIDSIDDKYCSLKLNLMWQVIDSLGTVDLSSVQEALLNVWVRNPIYLNDAKIMAFIWDRIFDKKIQASNTEILRVSTASELCLYLEMIEKMDGDSQKKFMFNNNNFFNQLIALCAQGAFDYGINFAAEDDAVRARAAKLYNAYLNCYEFATYREAMGDDDLLQDGKCSIGLDAHEAQVLLLWNNKSEEALRLSVNKMTHLLHGTAGVSYVAEYYYYNQAKENVVCTAEALCKAFPIFENGYQFSEKNATFIRLLATLGLDFKNPLGDPHLCSYNYNADFVAALQQTSSARKFTSADDQNSLSAIFAPLLMGPEWGVNGALGDQSLQPDHLNCIMDVYQLNGTDVQTQARTFFCLAALFARLSSSGYFGQELESPRALRRYAGALMKKAHELQAAVFPTSEFDNYTIWCDKMLGRGVALTCTAVLSGFMLSHAAKNADFKLILDGMKPPAWG